MYPPSGLTDDGLGQAIIILAPQYGRSVYRAAMSCALADDDRF